MPRKSNTRAASGAGSIRQRPDGRWEARVTVGSNPGTGKPIRRSIYGDTQAAVRKEMTAVLRDVDRGTYQTPSKMTVKIWMETWLDTFCTGLKPLTVSAYNTAMKTHIVPAFGAMPVQELKGIHVQKLFNDMLEAGKSPKTVKNTAAILHKALSVAVKQGYIAANPCEAAEVPKVTRHEIKPLTDAEIPVFLAAIEDHPFRNAYGLCLFAGLREGECLGLTWDCVDFDRAGSRCVNSCKNPERRAVHIVLSAAPKAVRSASLSLRRWHSTICAANAPDRWKTDYGQASFGTMHKTWFLPIRWADMW